MGSAGPAVASRSVRSSTCSFVCATTMTRSPRGQSRAARTTRVDLPAPGGESDHHARGSAAARSAEHPRGWRCRREFGGVALS